MVSPKSPPDPKTFEEMIGRLNNIGGEPRSAVVITHLYVEYLLDWILRKKIPKPDYIINQRFYSKLKIIESLKILSDQMMHELFIVNIIRNHFAHDIDIESHEFIKEFRNQINQMEFYKDTPYLSTIKEPYPIYSTIMMRVYHLLKDIFDRLPNPES